MLINPSCERNGKTLSGVVRLLLCGIMTTLGLAIVLLPVWAYLVAVTAAAARFARRPLIAAAGGPPVSILKPLHGAEPGLYENLRSFVDQDYPQLQIVLGVRHPADSALPIARALIADRPLGDIALIVDPRAGGSNLKVANLENMLPAARHPVLVLADSDMRVDPSYVAGLAGLLADPGAGLATCLYKGVSAGGTWSQLGALYINFSFLPNALLAEALGVGGGCFGATIALQRTVLERIGGFAPLRNELADDHRIGAAVRGLGLATVLSRYIVENRVFEPSFAGLWRHELRWARTMRMMAPAGYAGSAATHAAAIAVFAALAAGMSRAGCGFLLVSLVLRWASAGAIARLLGLPAARLWLLPLRDALSFAVFVASFCGRSVFWRDQAFRVEPSGRMTAEGDKPS